MVDTVLLVCAIVGGSVFAVRTVLQFLGVGADHDGIDMHHDHTQGDAGFSVLSLQGLSAFAMMFGVVGLALVRESGVAPSISLGLAALAGAASVWMIARMFAFMGRLQSSGTLNLYAALGAEGSVYLTLQAGGSGKVELIVQGRLGVFDAREKDGKAVATGRRVRVVGVGSGDVLVVEAIEAGGGTALGPL